MELVSLFLKSYKSYKGEERAASLPQILHLRPEGCRGILPHIFVFLNSSLFIDCIFRWCGTWACWSSRTLQKPPLSRTSKILGLFSRLKMARKGDLHVHEKCWYHNTVWRFEDYLRGWMKGIGDLLNESEQLRVETDDSGPQVFSELLLLKVGTSSTRRCKTVPTPSCLLSLRMYRRSSQRKRTALSWDWSLRSPGILSVSQ